YHDKDSFIPVRDLIALLDDFNVLKIGAHPLRKSTPWHHHEPSVLKQFDAYDLNGKDLFTDGIDMEKEFIHLLMNIKFQLLVVVIHISNYNMVLSSIYFLNVIQSMNQEKQFSKATMK